MSFGRKARRGYLRAVTGALLALLSATAFAPAFGRDAVEVLLEPRFAGPVIGVVMTVALTCLVLARGTRATPVTRVAAAVAGLAAYLVLAVAPGKQIVDGPRRLLSTALPVEPAGAELGTVVLVVGLATLGAVEPALRRRASLLPLLAPVSATGAGLAVSASAGPPAWWLGPLLALGAGVLLLTARRDRAVTTPAVPATTDGGSTQSPARRAWSAVIVAGIGIAVFLLAGLLVPAVFQAGRAAPADAQDLVSEPVRPRQLVTPLQLFPALRTGRHTLHLEIVTDRVPQRFRYVSLDRFDGQYWTRDTDYRRAGKRLPLVPTSAPTETREETIRVRQAGPLGWLPSSGRPVEVSVPNLGVNVETGDVVLPDDQPIRAEYTVRSVLPEPTLDELEAAVPTPPSRPQDAAAPPALASVARKAAGDTKGYPALVALERYFGEAGFANDISADAPSGHGLFQIQHLLTTKRGTAEQYASAFAVMARALGYDARVVVGFQPGEKVRDAYPVTGPLVHAWAEVRFAGLGWHAFDAIPNRETDEPLPDKPQPTPTQQPTPTPTPRESTPTASAGPPACPPPCRSDRPEGDPASDQIAVVAGLLGVLVLLALGVPLTKALRRRRARTLVNPDQRAAAAWRDALQSLAEAGLRPPASHTSGQVVTATAGRFGKPPASLLARIAGVRDEAVYGPEPVSPYAADSAWQHADGARRTIRDALARPRRWRAWLDPRPLLRKPGVRR